METWNAKHFNASEFDQKGLPGSGMQHMDRHFVGMLDQLREKVGFPLHVNSGYRSPAYNAKLSTTGDDGPHTTGRAADIRCLSGQEKFKLIQAAMSLGFTGIGIAKTYVHLDNLDVKADKKYAVRPNVWIYT